MQQIDDEGNRLRQTGRNKFKVRAREIWRQGVFGSVVRMLFIVQRFSVDCEDRSLKCVDSVCGCSLG